MNKRQTIEKIDIYLTKLGLIRNKNYTWSLQGPTLIYLGETDPFKSLTIGDVQKIKEMGAEFLIEPQ